jgi:ABC-type uncharacterized transport system permease subunit
MLNLTKDQLTAGTVKVRGLPALMELNPLFFHKICSSINLLTFTTPSHRPHSIQVTHKWTYLLNKSVVGLMKRISFYNSIKNFVDAESCERSTDCRNSEGQWFACLMELNPLFFRTICSSINLLTFTTPSHRPPIAYRSDISGLIR